MVSQQVSCSWRFVHPLRPRDLCGLQATSDGLCIFHSEKPIPNFAKELEREISKPEHWLEGAIIKADLNGLHLQNAWMPSASFEGFKIKNILLNGALLERANFRSTLIEGTIFNGSNLTGACFDRATLKKAKDFPVDLRNADLGGSSFTGARVEYVRLSGARFSQSTSISQLLKTPCYEMDSADWDEAAAVYGILGKRANEDWDFSSSDLCSYLAAICKHRRAIGAGSIKGNNWLHNWLIPTIRAGPIGLGWAVHCLVWGYGVRPFRAISAVFFVILLFGLIIFPFASAEQTGRFGGDNMIRSMANFVTMDYQNGLPAGRVEALLGAIEALLGTILLSLFLVALAGKYMRR